VSRFHAGFIVLAAGAIYDAAVMALMAAMAVMAPRLEATKLDAMALLFLFAVILVLCVLASCLEDEVGASDLAGGRYAEGYAEGYAEAYAEGYAEEALAGPRPGRRARERSPLWRTEEE
jgi:hypothetical protein